MSHVLGPLRTVLAVVDRANVELDCGHVRYVVMGRRSPTRARCAQCVWDPPTALRVKPRTGRFGTHYDTIPHGNCADPARCDCDCVGCISEYKRWREAWHAR